MKRNSSDIEVLDDFEIISANTPDTLKNKWAWHVFGFNTICILLPYNIKWYQRMLLSILLSSKFVKINNGE